MSKKVFTGINLDEKTLGLLKAIAAKETYGNRSAAVRAIILEAAKVRGLS